ncbi:hypothetical protein LY78DRAFT_466930 [Colletotrichum sublineola]|nr:hypothetical protein LY78DRAFT_466930 [Colletotrichum sublineola]
MPRSMTSLPTSALSVLALLGATVAHTPISHPKNDGAGKRDLNARNSTFKQFSLQVIQATTLTAATGQETGQTTTLLARSTEIAAPPVASFHDKAYHAQASARSRRQNAPPEIQS